MTDSTQNDLISSDGLPAAHKGCLKRIAGQMIPASTDLQLPGADDAQIITRITQRLGKQLTTFTEIYDWLEQASMEQFELTFAELNEQSCRTLLADFRSQKAALAGALMVTITSCYYEDERVLESIEHEARPPFPLGHKLDQGDWSLLDPVKKRPEFYRKTD
jgi:hypothetical protein